ncbi:hypothetical protein F1880_000036 [Penicillium rolfsii]|nr:hypothetical protein F1880_000036 [Penicillium rolfsii]
MGMDPEAEALLRQYQNLPTSSRQAVLRGILDQLPRDGWRLIKAQADSHTFQYDILGKLPLELAALVAEYLPLNDIICLRRVSHRWQRVLSSPALCCAVVRKTLGKNPWALSSPGPEMDTHATDTLTSVLTVSSDTIVSASTVDPGQSTSSYSTASFTKIVKRRLRLEQGDPYKVTTISSPIEGLTVPGPEEELDLRAFVAYSDGYCAWLDPKEDQTSVGIMNLFNGERENFTTDNREKLCGLRFSIPFIAAISLRGYCYIWNIETLESLSFRVPSIHFKDILISGNKVLVQFADFAVYWCFDTRVARTVKMKNERVIALALHPSENQITTICLCPRAETKRWHSVPLEGCQLRIEKYAIDSSNECCLLSSRHQPMSGLFGLEEGIHFASIEDKETVLYPDQYTVSMNIWEQATNGRSRTCRKICLSVEPDGLVAFHELPPDVHGFASPERGVVYGVRLDRPSANIVVMKSKTSIGPENSWVRYDYYVHRTKPTWCTPWIIGDARFLIIFDKKKMDIWTLDEPDIEHQEDVDQVDELFS